MTGKPPPPPPPPTKYGSLPSLQAKSASAARGYHAPPPTRFHPSSGTAIQRMESAGLRSSRQPDRYGYVPYSYVDNKGG